MSLAPLASADDVESRIKGDLTSEEAARVAVLLIDASAAVRDAAAGQEFTAGTTTLARLKVRRGIVRLPQRPATAVTTVEDDLGNTLIFQWLGDDRIKLNPNVPDSWAFEPYRNPLGEVLVTYDHGYDEIPDLIVGIVCNVALRALGRDPRDGGIVQESVAGYSYSTGSVGAAGSVGLLPEEKLRLAAFARPHAASVQGP